MSKTICFIEQPVKEMMLNCVKNSSGFDSSGSLSTSTFTRGFSSWTLGALASALLNFFQLL